MRSKMLRCLSKLSQPNFDPLPKNCKSSLDYHIFDMQNITCLDRYYFKLTEDKIYLYYGFS